MTRPGPLPEATEKRFSQVTKSARGFHSGQAAPSKVVRRGGILAGVGLHVSLHGLEEIAVAQQFLLAADGPMAGDDAGAIGNPGGHGGYLGHQAGKAAAAFDIDVGQHPQEEEVAHVHDED